MKALFYPLISFSAAAAIAFILTPAVRSLAVRFEMMDWPSERKAHERAVPTMGGISIWVAFFGAAGFYNAVCLILKGTWAIQNSLLWHLFFGSVPLFVLGIVDDKLGVNYKLKLAVQVAVGLLMVSLGHGIDGITNPLSGETIPLDFWGIPLTVIWFLFILNAINIIDGIDGLAAGVSLIASITIFFVANYVGNPEVAAISLILAGSIAGFLRYNFYPASIFMGDTGSLFLGFLLAVLSLHGAQKSSTAVALAIPIVILGLPILDVLVAVIRRWSSEWVISRSFGSRFLSWKKIFYPDLQHIHHRLLDIGLTKPQAVVVLYLVALAFGGAGFIMTAARYHLVALVLLYMGVVFFLAFYKFPALQRWFAANGDHAKHGAISARGSSKPDDQKEPMEMEIR